jgi:hypothetical protein
VGWKPLDRLWAALGRGVVAGAVAGAVAAEQGLPPPHAAVVASVSGGLVTAGSLAVPTKIFRSLSRGEREQSVLIRNGLIGLLSRLTWQDASDEHRDNDTKSRGLPATATLLAQNDDQAKKWIDLLISYAQLAKTWPDKRFFECLEILPARMESLRALPDEQQMPLLEILRDRNAGVRDRALILSLSKLNVTASEVVELLAVIKEAASTGIDLTLQEAVWLLLFIRLGVGAPLDKILYELRHSTNDDRVKRICSLLSVDSDETVAGVLDTGEQTARTIMPSEDELEQNLVHAIELAPI